MKPHTRKRKETVEFLMAWLIEFGPEPITYKQLSYFWALHPDWMEIVHGTDIQNRNHELRNCFTCLENGNPDGLILVRYYPERNHQHTWEITPAGWQRLTEGK